LEPILNPGPVIRAKFAKLHRLMLPSNATALADPCCPPLKKRIMTSTSEMIYSGISHYTFLPEGSGKGREAAPELFVGAPGLDRSGVHDRVADMVEQHHG
jgi:hypothetical protein